LLAITVTAVAKNCVRAEMPIRKNLFAPNGFLHAGTIVTLADTIAGFSTLAHLPKDGQSFTTLELKCNFTSAARGGMVVCESQAEHLGRTTHVWSVTVSVKDTGKKIALFSCTQLVLY
jgi:uncharacterized protein (TIGR00369 family)